MKNIFKLRHLLFAICAVAALYTINFAQEVGTIVWEGGVILRDAPSITATPLRIAERDDTVIILNESDGWYYVKYNLLSGYMRAGAEYITIEAPEEAENRDLGRGIPIENCNLRAAPSADATVVCVLLANTQLEIIGLFGDWYHILYIESGSGSGSGVYYEGYIRSDLIYLTEMPCGNSPGLLIGTFSSRAYRAIELAEQFLGTPYIFGARDPSRGFDCSGLVQYIAEQLGTTIARTAQQQSTYGTFIPYEDLQIGDLVFFTNTYDCPDLVTHVGFYYGNGQFLHAGGDHVQISNLSHPYYASRYYTARRVF